MAPTLREQQLTVRAALKSVGVLAQHLRLHLLREILIELGEDPAFTGF